MEDSKATQWGIPPKCSNSVMGRGAVDSLMGRKIESNHLERRRRKRHLIGANEERTRVGATVVAAIGIGASLQ